MGNPAKDGAMLAAAIVEALRRHRPGSREAEGKSDLAGPGPADRANAIRASAFDSVIAAASEAYKENARITAILDDKAQKAAQTAGVFLGAGFALMRPGTDNVANFVGDLGLWTMAGAIAMFLLTVILYSIENRIQRLPAPMNPERIYEMTIQLVELSDCDLLASRHLNFLNDVSGLWIEILAKQQVGNSTKARLVRLAQSCLALAMILVGVLLILVLQRARIH